MIPLKNEEKCDTQRPVPGPLLHSWGPFELLTDAVPDLLLSLAAILLQPLALRLSSTIGVLEEILSAQASFFPLDEEARWHIGSPESLKSLVLLLRSGDLVGRLNAVLVLKDLASSLDIEQLKIVSETKGLIEELVELIKKPISTRTTKASLVATFYLVSSSERTAMRFVEMGLVSLLVEILVDSNKSMSKKPLVVLYGVLKCKKGIEMAYDHSLTIPILVKKMFRVSYMGTELGVSAMWRLYKNYE